jgi:hypothetical protein
MQYVRVPTPDLSLCQIFASALQFVAAVSMSLPVLWLRYLHRGLRAL